MRPGADAGRAVADRDEITGMGKGWPQGDDLAAKRSLNRVDQNSAGPARSPKNVLHLPIWWRTSAPSTYTGWLRCPDSGPRGSIGTPTPFDQLINGVSGLRPTITESTSPTKTLILRLPKENS